MTGGVRRRDPAEVMRDEMIQRDRIVSLLREGAKTIPELAEALRCAPREVTLWVMALRRYGAVEELPKAKSEDYYRYRAAER